MLSKMAAASGKLTLVVKAAGMGSRFGGIKQLVALGPSGETLLEYSVYDALRAGFDRVVCVIRKAIEKQFVEDGTYPKLRFQNLER